MKTIILLLLTATLSPFVSAGTTTYTEQGGAHVSVDRESGAFVGETGGATACTDPCKPSKVESGKRVKASASPTA